MRLITKVEGGLGGGGGENLLKQSKRGSQGEKCRDGNLNDDDNSNCSSSLASRDYPIQAFPPFNCGPGHNLGSYRNLLPSAESDVDLEIIP